MKAVEYINSHIGENAKIGFKQGFVYCDTITEKTVDEIRQILKDKLEAFVIQNQSKPDGKKIVQKKIESFVQLDDRNVVESWRSDFDHSLLIIIEGDESGNVWKDWFDPLPKDAPDWGFRELAGEMVAAAAEDYKNAYSVILQKSETNLLRKPNQRRINEAERTLRECEKFFNSAIYAIVCPGISGEDAVEMIKKQVAKEYEEYREKLRIRQIKTRDL